MWLVLGNEVENKDVGKSIYFSEGIFPSCFPSFVSGLARPLFLVYHRFLFKKEKRKQSMETRNRSGLAKSLSSAFFWLSFSF